MKVFLSWSGELSHKVALLLRKWLPTVIESVEPYVSSEDMDKGARWSNDLAKELGNAGYGILCVTRENMEAPWLHFEAGALSKIVDKSRVSPFLFSIERSEVKSGPIRQFQFTVAEKEDVRKLLRSINGACQQGALDEAHLNRLFEARWSQLDRGLKKLELKSNTQPVANWEAAIEEAIPDVKIYGLVPEEPLLELEGAYPLTDSQTAAANSLRSTIKVNDPHALLLEEPDLFHNPLRLKLQTLDYAMLEVLRKDGQHPLIVSAGAVIVCPDARTVVFHHRSRNSRTFPDCIHIVGGAYQPPRVRPGVDDSLSLKSTAQREVKEETNAVITCDNSPPMLLAAEPSTRFFQFVLLGADISVNQLNAMKENWEGAGIVKMGFDELRTFLVSPPKPWVPSGKAHVLAWLALGAPGADKSPVFGKLSPQQLFSEVVHLSGV